MSSIYIKLKDIHKVVLYFDSYIYIYIYDFCSIFNDPKCSLGGAYIQTVKDEKNTLCEYTTQSVMFCTFVRYTFHLKKQRQNCYWI